jgi:hypothetical protein
VAERSFRDRFFTPPVGRAITSPSGIVAFGVGAAAAVLATAATGGGALVMVGAAALGGLLGFGARVAVAVPREPGTAHIDPFGVKEPWRHAVKDALQARDRYRDALRPVRSGPLLDTLTTIGHRLDEAVDECWQVAQQGQRVADARARINDREVRWQLQQTAAQIPPGTEAPPVQAKTIASLNAQLASAERMDQLLRSTYDQLDLLNARLDETVTQAIELSVTSTGGGLAPVGQNVEDITDSLSALREAMVSMEASPQVLDVTGGGAPEPDSAPYSAPPDAATTEPEPPGRVQGNPGT